VRTGRTSRFPQTPSPWSASRTHAPCGTKKNSPGQFHFRPPFPLTFAFRLLPLDSVSTYSRSVPGARGNLIAKFSFFNISTANLATCGDVCGKGWTATGKSSERRGSCVGQPSVDTNAFAILARSASEGDNHRGRRRRLRARARARGVASRGDPRAALGLAGARARNHPGRDRVASGLLVGSPDPRALGLWLALPPGPSGLQQDVRRRASPRHAARRRHLLLAGHRPVDPGLRPERWEAADRDCGRADRLVRRDRDGPGRARRRSGGELHREEARRARSRTSGLSRHSASDSPNASP